MRTSWVIDVSSAASFAARRSFIAAIFCRCSALSAGFRSIFSYVADENDRCSPAPAASVWAGNGGELGLV